MSDIPEQIGGYEVCREIGRGGMGVVYLGRDTKLDREVAIKALPEEMADDPARLVRFEREAKSLAQLNHPNIAGIYGVEEQGGRKYLILEYVEGETLGDRLDAGPMSVDDAVELAVEIAAGVEAAHEAGVVHRDLKPDNIKITPEGKVKVLDFGLAKAVATSSTLNRAADPTVTTARSPTIEGAILGTAAYMSPEQARARTVDKRTDIWSFGVLLFEMLAGAGPFAGESAHDSIGAVLHKDIDFTRLPPRTPAAVVRLVRRCLHRDRSRRLQSIADARVELLEVVDQLESGVIEGSAAAIIAKRPVWVLLVLVAAGVLAGLGGGWWLSGQQGSTLDEEPAVATPRLVFTRVTDDEGAEYDPALSPDGRDLVFSARDGDDWDIFRKRVGSFNAINLTRDFTDDDKQPAISPDGEFIVFRSDGDRDGKGGGLFIMGAMGDSPRRLTDFGYDPAWTPGGDSVVFATEGVRHPLGRDGLSNLWRVWASGGTPEQIPLEDDAIHPNVSPNGLRIAYWRTSSPGGIRDILTVPIEGGTPVHVTDDAATDWCPFWSPDGKHLYFVSDRSGVMNLWRVAIDETTGEPLSNPKPVTHGVGALHKVAISSTGSTIAITSIASKRALYRIEIDPEDGSLIDGPIVIAQDASAPEFSPDGTMIAYSGAWEDLFIINVDGTGQRRLTDDDSKNRGPKWIGSGDRLLFYSDREGGYAVWSCATDGSDLRRHTDEEFSITMPAISHDGKRFVFNYDYGDNRTYLQELMIDGLSSLSKIETELGESRGVWLDWSPDDKRLLGITHSDDSEFVPVILEVDAATVEKFEQFGRHAVFMPDGQRILVANKTNTAILLHDPRSGETSTVVQIPNLAIHHFAASPDGRYVAFYAEQLSADLWVGEFENDGH